MGFSIRHLNPITAIAGSSLEKSFSKSFGGANLYDPLDFFGGTARDYNSQEAEKQRSWEENLANSAIQRRQADLKAAGLNPTLAATDGADTPGGTAASTTRGNVSPFDIITTIANAKQANSAAELSREQAKVAQTQASLNSARTAKEDAETENIKYNTGKAKEKGIDSNSSIAEKTIAEFVRAVQKHGPTSAKAIKELNNLMQDKAMNRELKKQNLKAEQDQWIKQRSQLKRHKINWSGRKG